MRTPLFIAALFLCASTVGAAEPAQEKKAECGFVSIFNGKTLCGWQGAKKGYAAEDGILICERGGNLLTVKEYANFVFRFEFKTLLGGNNGVGIRTPAKGNAAYDGMEIQILDDDPPRKELQAYQLHGSIYGVVPAKQGHLKPAGKWNYQEIMADGSHIKVTLNGKVIVDADISKIDKFLDGHAHPGLKNKKGHIGFFGHGDRVEFRNLRIKEL